LFFEGPLKIPEFNFVQHGASGGSGEGGLSMSDIANYAAAIPTVTVQEYSENYY